MKNYIPSLKKGFFLVILLLSSTTVFSNSFENTVKVPLSAVSISERPITSLAIIIPNIDDQTICAGDPIILSVFGTTGNGTLIYQWKQDGTNLIDDGVNISGSNTETLTIDISIASDAGIYTCEIIDDDAVATTSNAATITITALPAAPSAAPQNFCSTDSPSGADLIPAISISIKWYTNASLTIPIGTSTPLTTKNYYVTKIVDLCESNATTVAVTVTPVAPTAGTVTQPTCSVATGSFIISNYDASYSYAFTPSVGVTNTAGTGTAPAGTYTITATLGACTSVASANVVVNAQPITPVAPEIECYETATFNSETCAWVVTGDPPEEVDDVLLCNTDTDSTNFITLPTYGLVNVIDSFVSGGTWTDIDSSNGLIGDSFDPRIVKPGTYKFTYKEPGDCGRTITLSVDVADCVVFTCIVRKNIEISKVVTANNDGVNDFFSISDIAECGFTGDVSIFNRWGKRVYYSNDYQNNWGGYHDGSGQTMGSNDKLPTGTYYYVVKIVGSGFKPITGYIYLGTN
jgi:gliding motility-associated-like protein